MSHIPPVTQICMFAPYSSRLHHIGQILLFFSYLHSRKINLKVQPVWHNKSPRSSVSHTIKAEWQKFETQSHTQTLEYVIPWFAVRIWALDVGEMEGGGWASACPLWPESVYHWSVCAGVFSMMTDELAVDLGGLGDSLSVRDSREASCALTSSQSVIEFTIVHHSSKVYMALK